jgi:hypothetical protein
MPCRMYNEEASKYDAAWQPDLLYWYWKKQGTINSARPKMGMEATSLTAPEIYEVDH